MLCCSLQGRQHHPNCRYRSSTTVICLSSNPLKHKCLRIQCQGLWPKNFFLCGSGRLNTAASHLSQAVHNLT